MNTITKPQAPERTSVPTPQAHPDRLATIAQIFGLNSQPVSTARVLEIGCADAGNLITSAYTLPNAKFVGIDQSAKQIEKGQDLAKKLELKNVELHASENFQLKQDIGEFDYIIANGIFSWVNQTLQERILDICDKHLKPNGVAFISYNTYPGWHFRGMIRDMMHYHAGQIADPAIKAQQSRALLDFLSQSVPVENNAYGMLLRGELNFLSAQPDGYLLQDIMAESNEPFYFYQFIERANSHNLSFLGEAEFSTMMTSNFPPSVGETLRRISNEIVRTEQYMDFVRNRTFRQTLLCKSSAQINRNVDANKIMSMLVSSPIKPEKQSANLQSNAPENFVMPNGFSIQTANPLTKAALLCLSEAWPRSCNFDELHGAALARLSDVLVQDGQTAQAQKQVLATDLLSAFAAGVVFLRTEQAPLVTFVSERPKASALARAQAPEQWFVSTQLHESIAIDAFARQLIQELNGKRDHIQIVDQLVEAVNKGQLLVQKDGKNISDQTALRKTLESLMNECLDKMAKAGVLIG